MAYTSVLTTYGEQLITDAIASGNTINLPKFIISSSNSFELTQSLNTLPDIVYTSSDTSAFSIIKVADNTVEFRIYLNTTIGDFNIGTIGILDDNDKLVVAGQLDNIIVKKETTESQEGNTLQFKIPINITNVSQVVTSIGQEFQVDNKTILIDSEGVISCGVVPHHVFDIFQNASTSNPPGALPLWTGETVYCNGAHEEFYTKAVEYAAQGYIRSITTSTYNSEVSSKGWTNGFVINSGTKSIRLPKFKGVLYMNDPSSTTSSAATAGSNTNYGFITLPTYIQIDTAAVPATVAQCNAFNEVLEDFATQFVTLATAQTITGAKTFTSNYIVHKGGYPRYQQYNTDCVKGTAPANNETMAVQFMDTNGNLLGTVQTDYVTSKKTVTQLRVYKAQSASDSNSTSIGVGYNEDGNAYTWALSPSLSSNASDYANQIVTVGYLNSSNSGVVHTTRNETITGTKTFQADPIIRNGAPRLYLGDPDQTKGTAPSGTQWSAVEFQDTNGVRLGLVRQLNDSTKLNRVEFLVEKANEAGDNSQATMSLYYPANGSPYATAPASNVADSILTTIDHFDGVYQSYYKLGNGLIIQWGKFTASGHSAQDTVTFPTAFTSSNASVTITRDDNMWSEGVPMQVQSITTTDFKCRVNAGVVHWIAIGY